MNLKIIAEEKLSKHHLEDVIHLYHSCNIYDSSKYIFDEDSDFRKSNEVNTFLLYRGNDILSSLHIFAPGKTEAEITALTLPGERKKGYFRKLLKLLKEELLRRGIESVLFVCDVASKDGNEVIRHIGARYEYSEFLMSFAGENGISVSGEGTTEIVKASMKDMNRYIEINSRAFNANQDETADIIKEFFSSNRRELYGILLEKKLIGMIGIYTEQFRHYIYGFCIDPDYQKMGIGHFALSEIVSKCLEKDRNKAINLEVQTNNQNALKLYRNTGFEVETEFRYYRDNVYNL